MKVPLHLLPGRRRESGSTLIAVVVIVGLLLLGGTLYVQRSLTNRTGSRLATTSLRVGEVADSALQLGIRNAQEELRQIGNLDALFASQGEHVDRRGRFTDGSFDCYDTQGIHYDITYTDDGDGDLSTLLISAEAAGANGVRAKRKVLAQLTTAVPSTAAAIEIHGDLSARAADPQIYVKPGRCNGVPAMHVRGTIRCSAGQAHFWANQGAIEASGDIECDSSILDTRGGTAHPSTATWRENVGNDIPDFEPGRCGVDRYAANADVVLRSDQKILVGGVDRTSEFSRPEFCDEDPTDTRPFFWRPEWQTWMVCNANGLDGKIVFSEHSMKFVNAIGSVGDGTLLSDDAPSKTTFVSRQDIWLHAQPNAISYVENAERNPNNAALVAGRDILFGNDNYNDRSVIRGEVCAEDDISIQSGDHEETLLFERETSFGIPLGQSHAWYGTPIFEGRIIAGNVLQGGDEAGWVGTSAFLGSFGVAYDCEAYPADGDPASPDRPHVLAYAEDGNE